MSLPKGTIVVMKESTVENYGEEWRDVEMRITHVATKYMSASEFYKRGMPDGYHPGYDEGVGQPLYDLETMDGTEVSFSLYRYEVKKGDRQ